MDLSWLLGAHDSFNLAVEVLMEFQKVAGASGSGLHGGAVGARQIHDPRHVSRKSPKSSFFFNIIRAA